MNLSEVKLAKPQSYKNCKVCGTKIGKGGRDHRFGVCDKHVYESYLYESYLKKFKPGMDPFLFSPISRKEIERYIGNQAEMLNEDDFAQYFNEAFSDKFEDYQIDNQTFDAIMNHTYYWSRHRKWPPGRWKWWN